MTDEKNSEILDYEAQQEIIDRQDKIALGLLNILARMANIELGKSLFTNMFVKKL